MLIIKKWYGRYGNNVIQLIHAIKIALIKKHKKICFPNHILFSKKEIILEEMTYNKTIIENEFFFLKEMGFELLNIYEMRDIFQKYILDIFKININNENINNKDEIVIHIRGGDIFSRNPHRAYVQPPMSYYNNVTKNYKQTMIISEDKKNPCINHLLKNNNVKFKSSSVMSDLEYLCNAQNLMIGFSSFGIIPFFCSKKLKNYYIPNYVDNIWFKGNYGNEINTHKIEIKNYIEVGNWKNTPEQINLMLSH